MTVLTDNSDIVKIEEAGRIIRDLFGWTKSLIQPGISTLEIDEKIEAFIEERGGKPAFKGYRGYPGTICASVNEVVVHGIPRSDVVLKEGDIIGIDVGLQKSGFFVDAAKTYAVGDVSKDANDLMDATAKCLEKGIDQAIAGNRVFDISNAIQNLALERGYQEVRSFVGHGIGVKLHESPEVPNWGEKGKGPVLKFGQLLAIEPMINAGTRNVKILKDNWTAVTEDGKLSAHFEHTIMVGKEKAKVLT